MDMADMVKALAGMPDEQRTTMMSERLRMFAELDERERSGQMRAMMEALGTLPQEDKRKLIKSRTQALCELPGDTQMSLMKTHMGLLERMPPERAQMEMKLIQEITPELKPEHRQQVMEMMKSMPMPGGMQQRAASGAMGGRGSAPPGHDLDNRRRPTTAADVDVGGYPRARARFHLRPTSRSGVETPPDDRPRRVLTPARLWRSGIKRREVASCVPRWLFRKALGRWPRRADGGRCGAGGGVALWHFVSREGAVSGREGGELVAVELCQVVTHRD